MSIGPLGTAVNVAGTPLAQTKGAEMDRVQREVGAQQRRVYHERKAQAASDIGEPDGEDHETDQRTPDGRRPWEEPPEAKKQSVAGRDRQSKDPTRQSGNLLDLTG
jgi:hypothetical protein